MGKISDFQFRVQSSEFRVQSSRKDISNGVDVKVKGTAQQQLFNVITLHARTELREDVDNHRRPRGLLGPGLTVTWLPFVSPEISLSTAFSRLSF